MKSERHQARYLNLRMEPATEEANALVSKVAELCWANSAGKRKKPSFKFNVAVAAFVADLIKANAIDPKQPLYRSMKAKAFTGQTIGYRAFKRVVQGAQACKLVVVKTGTGGGTLIGEATRIAATTKLIDLARSCDVDLLEWRRHFRSIPRPTNFENPLVLKSASRLVGGRKIEGNKMGIDSADPKVLALMAQVDDINAFFARVAIDHDSEHYAFQRIFNLGDQPDFDWNKGGRLYSVGDSYQQRKPFERASMKLNGEPVVEIDIRASHLSIIHALLGKPFDPAGGDPYLHPFIPRRVVKGWIVTTLGHDRFHRAWSSDMIADYRNRTGNTLGKDFPIKLVRAEVLEMLPALTDWPASTIRWADLQFIESCAVIDTVHELAVKHDVPALPVHDSIIVPESKKELACQVLKTKFTYYVVVEPSLTVK